MTDIVLVDTAWPYRCDELLAGKVLLSYRRNHDFTDDDLMAAVVVRPGCTIDPEALVEFRAFGCCGSDIDTPNVDGLAAGGLQFTNNHVTPLSPPPGQGSGVSGLPEFGFCNRTPNPVWNPGATLSVCSQDSRSELSSTRSHCGPRPR